MHWHGRAPIPCPRLALGGAFALAALLVTAFWVFGRSANDVPTLFREYVAHEHTVSFLWPVITIVTGLVVSGLLWWRPRWSKAGLSVLLGTEVLALLAAGGVLISSSSNAYPATTAVRQLQQIVGDARVGTGGSTTAVGCPLGILPDANILFGIHQVNMNEPIMPKKYFSTWQAQNHSSPGNARFSQFCPVIASVAQARQLGVSYVLEPAGFPGPPGAKYVTTLQVPNPNPGLRKTTSSNEDLYFIPASGIVTLSTPAGGETTGRPNGHLGVSSSNSGTLDVRVHQTEAGTLHFHVSDVPGWHATIDGKPLALRPSSEFDLRAEIPPGKHEIKLQYWPSLFSAGLILAAIAALGIGFALSLAWLRARRRKSGGATS